MTDKNWNGKGLWDKDKINTIISSPYIGAACIFDYCNSTVNMLAVNDKFVKQLGLPGMTTEEAISFPWLDFITPRVKKQQEKSIQQMINEGGELDKEIAFFTKTLGHGKRFIGAHLQLVDIKDGHSLIFCSTRDLTELRLAEEELGETKEKLQAIIDNVNGGISAAVISRNGTARFLFANDQYYKQLGRTREEIEESQIDIFDLVHPEDRKQIRELAYRASMHHKSYSCIYRVIKKDKSIVWMKSNVSMAKLTGVDEPVQISVANDITDQVLAQQMERDAAEAILLHEEEVRLAMAQMGKIIAEYDVSTMTLTIPKDFADEIGIPTVCHNIPYCEFDNHFIRDEFRDEFIRFYESILGGEKSGTMEVMGLRHDETWHWDHYQFVTIFGVNKKPLKAIIAIEDVTEFKVLQERYEKEIQLRHELIHDSNIYYQINLDTGILEEYRTTFSDTPNFYTGALLDEKIQDEILESIIEPDRYRMKKYLFCNALKNAYRQGKPHIHEEYRRRTPQNQILWFRLLGSIMKRPDTDELIAFLYVIDIDYEKKKQLALEAVTKEEIEAAVVVHIADGQAFVAGYKDSVFTNDNDPKFSYNGFIRKYAKKYIVPEEQKAALQFASLQNLLKLLEKESIVEYIYHEPERERRAACKMIRVIYLDELREDIVLSLQDVTKLYANEERQKQLLKDAVNRANEASQAKSEFISKISHDIRTPLNAVLVYSGHDMRKDATEQHLNDYLQKINISAEYLLGIINDVLDMTKIEQKKFTLQYSRYSFREFFDTIQLIIGELSKQNKIDFVITEGNVTKCDIMTDKVRLNQIIINLLSNAVKYTPEGGRIELRIDTYKLSKGIVSKGSGNYSYIRFTISDTGIGMKKEFLTRLFEPFTQENRTEGISRQQGSGLGLTIVKQLVQLMNGTIQVESEVGKGSRFIVQIPFEIANTASDVPVEEIDISGTLEGVHILLCEDNEINAELISLLLEKRGCIVDCALNGKAGVIKYMASPDDYYDIILMDLHMPVMNGYEASKAIRKAGRSDARTIPIIAITAEVFLEENQLIKQTGMNGYLTKPIITDDLYRLIMENITT